MHDCAVVSKTLCYLYFWGSQNLWFLLWIIFKWPFPIWNNNDITGKYACEGKVENKFDMKPHSENLAEYGKLCRERTTKCMAKPRRVEVTDQMIISPTGHRPHLCICLHEIALFAFTSCRYLQMTMEVAWDPCLAWLAWCLLPLQMQRLGNSPTIKCLLPRLLVLILVAVFWGHNFYRVLHIFLKNFTWWFHGSWLYL